MVLRDSMAPVLCGLAAGILGSVLAGRAIASLLFGVHTIGAGSDGLRYIGYGLDAI